MSGYRVACLPWLIDQNNPIGVKLEDGTEVRLPNLTDDGSGLRGPDGSIHRFNPRGNVQAAASHYPTPTNNGGTVNSTWFHALSAWDDFHAVQLVFSNSSASPVTVEAVAVAATTTIYPAGANNIALPQGGGAWSTPLQNLTVPAGAALRTPGFLVTPKIAVSSLPRAAGELDNGKYPLLLVKTYVNGTNTTFAYASLNTAMGGSSWDAVNEGFTLQTGRVGGDMVVTTPAGGSPLARSTGPILTLVGVIFTYNRKVSSVCGIGDSIMQGYLDGVTNNCPFAFKATARIRAGGYPVSYLNGGIAGSTIIEINQHGKDLITNCSPDVVILPSFSPNSPTAAQSDWDAQWYQVMDLAATQLARGKHVVLLTPYPNNAFNSTTNAYRLKQRQRVINSGLPYADIESAVVDTAGGIGNYKTGMNNDVTHPSPAGHEAIAAVLQPVLLQVI